MSPLTQHKPKLNRHPAFVKIDDFMARLADYVIEGEQGLADYMKQYSRVEGDSVVIIYRDNFQHAATVTKHP